MRKPIGGLAVLLVVAGVALTPKMSHAQLGAVPPPPGAMQVPWPFGRPHLDEGGFYVAGEFIYWKQTNPLKDQGVAFRGVLDVDGTIGQALGRGQIPGVFIGSHADALDVNYISGPRNFQPGFNFTFGYRFESGVALEMKWIHLFDVRYAATASLIPNSQIGLSAEETFLSSPVYNFTTPFFGPGNTTGIGSNFSLAGIWNGASIQYIDFIQRFDQWEMTARIPMLDSECWRTYGLVGPRLVSMWERFKWRVTHPEADGTVPPEDVAIYSNVVSNRLYGVHFGVGNEWMLGDTPCGAFSISLDVDVALFIDFMKGRPKYELSDSSVSASHPRNLASLVPEVSGQLNLWWYPYEGIVFRVGYDGMAFFNTFSSPRPIDFNFGSITPAYESTLRVFHGINLGAGIIF